MNFITKPEESHPKDYVIGMLYGPPGSWKTTLAISIPNIVLANFDDGLDRVQPNFRVDSIKPKDYMHFLNFIRSEEFKQYYAIAIDTFGKFVDSIADHVATENPKLRQADGQMTQKGWGSIKICFKQFLKELISQKKHIIFVAHESESKVGEKTIKRPDCSGSSGRELIKELDFMGYMQPLGKKMSITFNPSDEFYAKNSLELEEMMMVPILSSEKHNVKDNTFLYDQVIKRYYARIDKNIEITKAYIAIKKEDSDLISTVKNIDDINKAFSKLSDPDKQQIWDTKYVAKKLLSDKAKDLNLIYDNEKKSFVNQIKKAS